MIEEFRVHKGPVDVAAFDELVRQMEEVVESLPGMEGAPVDSPEMASFVAYCDSLVNGVRGPLGRTRSGSWAVAETDEHMPVDARCDFIFRPTYAAVATLAWLVTRFPSSLHQIPNLLSALREGLHFCTHRELQGHGYEAESEAIRALRTMAIGGVVELLESSPWLCPELRRIMVKLREYASRVADGTAEISVWGTDDKSRANARDTVEWYDRSMARLAGRTDLLLLRREHIDHRLTNAD